MLIEFSVGNFLSFKNLVTFSMVASSIKEHQDTNVFTIDDLNLLKSGVIYGANASGKSNFIKAIRFMRKFVINSSKDSQAKEVIDVTAFKLNTETENKPCHFEVIFIHNDIRYRYGFQVDSDRVYQEWLFHSPKGQEAKLFTRDLNNIKLGTHFSEGKGLAEKTRNNALFLSVVAQFNGELSMSILDWFIKLKIISGLQDETLIRYTIKQLLNTKMKEEIVKFLKIADLGIDDINISELETSNLPDEVPSKFKELLLNRQLVSIDSFHKKYDAENKFVALEWLDFSLSESEGTKKIFALSALLLDTLKEGSVVVIDELDSRLHPLLTRFIVGLFNSTAINPTNAQLIFATHDTNLLNKAFFRRDQIWFTEKDQYGATDLYSLVEYKTNDDVKVRNDASFEKDYILGKYGAIPFIGEVEALFGDHHGE